VQFSSAGSGDPDGDAITYAWDFTTNGSTDSTAANPSFTYTGNGEFTATLTVRDSTGRSSTASLVIGVGRPTVALNLPLNGRLFNFGDAIPFQVTVTDPNASTVDCGRVKVSYVLGHDSHGHGITSATGCSGTLQTTADGEHDPNANIFGVMTAEYTPVGSTTPVTSPQAVLQPRTRQAEHYSGQQGITVVAKPSANGGSAVGFIENGDWISFTPYNLSGATSFTARVASAGSGGTITLRGGSATGPVIGTATVASTGGWETWTTVVGTITPPAGTQNLFLVFTGGSGNLFDIDAFTLGSGGTPPPPNPPPPNPPPPNPPPPNPPPPPPPNPTTFRLRSESAGRCLDVNGASSANGAQMIIWDCHTATNQQFSQNGQELRVMGKCLEVPANAAAGTRVRIWDCSGGTNQRWTLNTNGTVSNGQNGLCLDVNAAGTANGTAVVVWNCHTGANQRWARA
jgi:PKD repeat protein